jgi:redox-sensitive bicupin YhaK (pirin superfamily)
MRRRDPEANAAESPTHGATGTEPTRRDLLAAIVPAAVVLATGGKALADPDDDRPGGGAAGAAPLRPIQGVYAPPGLHWVGDGFLVAGYFSRIPDALRRLDPFVLFDYHPEHNYPPTTRRRGVGPHPHRGFETVTFAFQGSVAHHDSTGAGGIIGPGDVQWMTAASGILHKEYHEDGYGRRGGPFQMAQLWVNLPAAHKMKAPRYQAILARQMGAAPLSGGAGEVRVLAGEHLGARGPARTFTPMTILDVRLNANGAHDLTFPASYTAALLVMSGDVALQGSRRVRANDFVLFERQGERIAIRAAAASRLLVLAGEPIGERVVQHGPFVMNTQEEIAKAYADFRAGKFGYLAD